MLLKKLKIYNYKKFEDFSLDFDNNFSIMIGNNGAGKSTLLEAIHLALTGTVNGKPIFYELSPIFLMGKLLTSLLRKCMNPGNTKEWMTLKEKPPNQI